MPKSKSRRRRNASRVLAPASQSLMQDLSVEVQGDKVVPVPEVVDPQPSSKEPLVEITAVPQSKEPIVRVCRLRRPPILEITAAETILAEAEQRQAKSTPRDAEDDPEAPPTAPCNRDQPGLDNIALDEVSEERAQSFRSEEPDAERQEVLAAEADASKPKSALVQQTTDRVKQASAGLLTAAQGMLTPMTAKIADLRAKRQSASLEKKTKDDATRNALESTEAKGDLQRIASSLEARSTDGDSGDSGGPSSKARTIIICHLPVTLDSTVRIGQSRASASDCAPIGIINQTSVYFSYQFWLSDFGRRNLPGCQVPPGRGGSLDRTWS